MRALALLVLLLPATALAQGVEPPPPDPVGSQQPPPPPVPQPQPVPQPPPPRPPPPPGYGYQPQYVAQTTESLRQGMTVELNLGLGWIRVSADGDSATSDLGLGGLNLGLGGWVSPKMAITARIAGVTLSENGNSLTNGVLVGSLQYWVDDHFWFGGGAGLGVLALQEGNDDDGESVGGLGLDLRVGYTFSTGTENTWNASFELTPTFLEENGDSATFTGIGILLGYQHL
jgi:hypothetical protein